MKKREGEREKGKNRVFNDNVITRKIVIESQREIEGKKLQLREVFLNMQGAC